jgi:hypothetical protein
MLASPTSGHDPGNAEKIATWEHPFVGRLAPGCWRWLKLNGKADCPEVVQINVRSTGTLRQTQDAFFGSNCQKCVERTPDKTPNNKPRSIAETIGCERDTLTSRKARSGKFPWISGVHRRTNPSPHTPAQNVLVWLPPRINPDVRGHHISRLLDPPTQVVDLADCSRGIRS